MAENSEKVAEFVGITGAPAHVAENYLIAHDYDVERAIDFYFAHPPQEGGVADDSFDQPQEAAGADPFLEGLAEPAARRGRHAAVADAPQNVIEIPDDDEEDAGLQELARQRANALAARQQAEQQMEGMMGAAQNMFRQAGMDIPADMLAVRGRGLAAAAAAGPSGNRRPPGAAGGAELTDMDMDDDDMQAIAAAVAGAGDGAAVPGAAGHDFGSFHQQQQRQMLAHYQQMARQRQAAGPAAGGLGGMDADDDDDAAAVAAAAAADAAEAAAAAVAGDAAAGDLPLDLPEGINLEEARMLEAAMLGVPYQGRIPDFTAAALPQQPLSPGALEQRNLRAEQDAAYEESLALDRAKQESITAAKAAEEARQLAQQEAAEAAARAEAEAKQAMAALLASKRQRLPAEPSSSEAGCITIVVRMPDGSRKGRRFKPTHQLQAVFDFVDVTCGEQQQQQQEGGEAGCGGIKPGSYRLVTQFPRKVYVEGSGESLQEAGITSDSALFIEAL